MIQCWYYRKIILTAVDESGPLPNSARRHVQGCVRCYTLYRSQSDVACQLQAGAEPPPQAPSPFLHGRIMSAVGRAGEQTQPRPASVRWGWAIAIVAVCVLAPFVWKPARLSSVSAGRAPVANPPDLSPAMNLPNEKQLARWAGNLDEPLQNEMKSVVHDAETAANALADNFVPEPVRSYFAQIQN